MSDGLPALTVEERLLLGPRLHEPQAYLKALLLSAHRQEALLGEILARLGSGTPPATSEAAPAPKAKARK